MGSFYARGNGIQSCSTGLAFQSRFDLCFALSVLLLVFGQPGREGEGPGRTLPWMDLFDIFGNYAGKEDELFICHGGLRFEEKHGTSPSQGEDGGI